MSLPIRSRPRSKGSIVPANSPRRGVPGGGRYRYFAAGYDGGPSRFVGCAALRATRAKKSLSFF
jgi:hypothetical protein